MWVLRVAICGAPRQFQNHAEIDKGSGIELDQIELVPVTPGLITFIVPLLMLLITIFNIIAGVFALAGPSDPISCYSCKDRHLWDDSFKHVADLTATVQIMADILTYGTLVVGISSFTTAASSDAGATMEEFANHVLNAPKAVLTAIGVLDPPDVPPPLPPRISLAPHGKSSAVMFFPGVPDVLFPLESAEMANDATVEQEILSPLGSSFADEDDDNTTTVAFAAARIDAIRNSGIGYFANDVAVVYSFDLDGHDLHEYVCIALRNAACTSVKFNGDVSATLSEVLVKALDGISVGVLGSKELNSAFVPASSLVTAVSDECIGDSYRHHGVSSENIEKYSCAAVAVRPGSRSKLVVSQPTEFVGQSPLKEPRDHNSGQDIQRPARSLARRGSFQRPLERASETDPIPPPRVSYDRESNTFCVKVNAASFCGKLMYAINALPDFDDRTGNAIGFETLIVPDTGRICAPRSISFPVAHCYAICVVPDGSWRFVASAAASASSGRQPPPTPSVRYDAAAGKFAVKVEFSDDYVEDKKAEIRILHACWGEVPRFDPWSGAPSGRTTAKLPPGVTYISPDPAEKTPKCTAISITKQDGKWVASAGYGVGTCTALDVLELEAPVCTMSPAGHSSEHFEGGVLVKVTVTLPDATFLTHAGASVVLLYTLDGSDPLFDNAGNPKGEATFGGPNWATCVPGTKRLIGLLPATHVSLECHYDVSCTAVAVVTDGIRAVASQKSDKLELRRAPEPTVTGFTDLDVSIEEEGGRGTSILMSWVGPVPTEPAVCAAAMETGTVWEHDGKATVSPNSDVPGSVTLYMLVRQIGALPRAATANLTLLEVAPPVVFVAGGRVTIAPPQGVDCSDLSLYYAWDEDGPAQPGRPGTVKVPASRPTVLEVTTPGDRTIHVLVQRPGYANARKTAVVAVTGFGETINNTGWVGLRSNPGFKLREVAKARWRTIAASVTGDGNDEISRHD